MRSRLLLALFAVPVLCAAISDTAGAQSRAYRYRDNGRSYRYRDDGRTYVYRTDRMGRSIDRGYRNRIYMQSYRYKEPVVRSRTVYRGSGYRYGNDYGYRNYGYDYGYNYDYRYRDGYYTRRRGANLIDLVLSAAGARYRDRSYHRHTSRCRHGRGLHISL